MNVDTTNISKPSGSEVGWPSFPIYGGVGGITKPTTPSPGAGYQWSSITNSWQAPGSYGNTPSSTPQPHVQPQTNTNYTKPAGWTDAQWAAWQSAAQGGDLSLTTPSGTTPVTTPTITPTTTPTTPPTTTPTDPFTSWLNQQNVFPYTQSTLGMSGWNPAMGYNPAAAGYNPSAMPNYTMDTYP